MNLCTGISPRRSQILLLTQRDQKKRQHTYKSSDNKSIDLIYVLTLKLNTMRTYMYMHSQTRNEYLIQLMQAYMANPCASVPTC